MNKFLMFKALGKVAIMIGVAAYREYQKSKNKPKKQYFVNKPM